MRSTPNTKCNRGASRLSFHGGFRKARYARTDISFIILTDVSFIKCFTEIGGMSISSNLATPAIHSHYPPARVPTRRYCWPSGSRVIVWVIPTCKGFSILASDRQEHRVIRHSFRMSPMLLIRYGPDRFDNDPACYLLHQLKHAVCC